MKRLLKCKQSAINGQLAQNYSTTEPHCTVPVLSFLKLIAHRLNLATRDFTCSLKEIQFKGGHVCPTECRITEQIWTVFCTSERLSVKQRQSSMRISIISRWDLTSYSSNDYIVYSFLSYIRMLFNGRDYIESYGKWRIRENVKRSDLTNFRELSQHLPFRHTQNHQELIYITPFPMWSHYTWNISRLT
jgi:hypothetical protein